MEIQKVETVQGRFTKECKFTGQVIKVLKGKTDKTIKVQFNKYSNNYDDIKGKKILVFIFVSNGEYRVHNGRRGFYLENQQFYDPSTKSSIPYKEIIKRIETKSKS